AAFPVEKLGDLQRARADRGIGRANDRALGRARDDLTPAMLERGIVEDLVAEQRPVLHQAIHRLNPVQQTGVRSIGAGRERALPTAAAVIGRRAAPRSPAIPDSSAPR